MGTATTVPTIHPSIPLFVYLSVCKSFSQSINQPGFQWSTGYSVSKPSPLPCPTSGHGFHICLGEKVIICFGHLLSSMHNTRLYHFNALFSILSKWYLVRNYSTMTASVSECKWCTLSMKKWDRVSLELTLFSTSGQGQESPLSCHPHPSNPTCWGSLGSRVLQVFQMAPSSHWHLQLWPVTIIIILKTGLAYFHNERPCNVNYVLEVCSFQLLRCHVAVHIDMQHSCFRSLWKTHTTRNTCFYL